MPRMMTNSRSICCDSFALLLHDLFQLFGHVYNRDCQLRSLSVLPLIFSNPIRENSERIPVNTARRPPLHLPIATFLE